jgi:hypothetical protein
MNTDESASTCQQDGPSPERADAYVVLLPLGSVFDGTDHADEERAVW